ncbi:MAG: carboxypeptidase-like regulatory domain-containing protein [Sphingobacteriaceae bacterium]
MRLVIILFSFLIHQLHSQTTLIGSLIDEDTKEPIPFASVGSKQTKAAVLTNEKGEFKLTLQHANESDSIKFFAIGYFEYTVSIKELNTTKQFKLKASAVSLDEVQVSAKKLYNKKLGVTNYDKRNCSGFIDLENNWKGVETAIRLPNSDHKRLQVKDFSFYIIKNTIKDTLTFRLNFYSSNQYYPTRNILKKPIIFKTAIKQGEFKIDLMEYNIIAYDDFYVSVACLMDKVSITDFCFAGENTEPSYVRENAIHKWKKIRGGGAAFNVTVLYSKKD